MIDDEFGRRLLDTFNDSGAHPVHLLFNQWWNHAPADVTQSYLDQVLAARFGIELSPLAASMSAAATAT